MDPVDRDRQRFGWGVFGKEYELRVFGPRRNVLVSRDPLSVLACRFTLDYSALPVTWDL